MSVVLCCCQREKYNKYAKWTFSHVCCKRCNKREENVNMFCRASGASGASVGQCGALTLCPSNPTAHASMSKPVSTSPLDRYSLSITCLHGRSVRCSNLEVRTRKPINKKKSEKSELQNQKKSKNQKEKERCSKKNSTVCCWRCHLNVAVWPAARA